MTVPALYAYTIPEVFSDAEAAPLLCAGAIGYRSLRLTGLRNGQILALYGFGASGHLVFKLARFLYPDSPVFVHARSEREQEFALSLGADWAGDTLESPPDQPHAVIEMTPAWEPVLAALETIRPGGRVVINVIRKEPGDSYRLSSLSYERHLWMEKEIKSVANITRGDVREFLGIAANMALKAEVQLYQLENANQALLDIRERRIRGAKVLQIL
jgi:propanol-preferring alcohol dehydrogenase